MFHVKRLPLFLIVFIFSFYQTANSQGYISLSDKDFLYEHQRKADILEALDTLEAYHSLEEVEKESLYWINFVRLYPQQFNHDIVLPFLEQFPEVISNYTKSLIAELNKATPASVVKPHEKLNKIAYTHAKDLGTNGHPISHNSSSGESFQQRMNRGGIFSCVSENVYEGKQRALESVLFLLIDSGVPSLGHRKNILDKTMHTIGIAFHPIKGKKGMYYSVQNFYCGDPL